jgi:hypothetical protein
MRLISWTLRSGSEHHHQTTPCCLPVAKTVLRDQADYTMLQSASGCNY